MEDFKLTIECKDGELVIHVKGIGHLTDTKKFNITQEDTSAPADAPANGFVGIKRHDNASSSSSPHSYPEGTKKTQYHKGCWLITDNLEQYYPTQQQAADAASERFGIEIRRYDIYNALRYKQGNLYAGDRLLCIVAYSLD